MLDDFRLRVFETLCSTLSFTQTAKLLGVSQPAISQNISELERDLGVSLFDRNGGKVTLNENGEKFRGYSHQLLHWYRAASAAFSSEEGSKPVEVELDSGKVVQIWTCGEDIHLKLKTD